MDLLLSPSLHQVSFSLHSFSDNFPQKDPSEYLERILGYAERALRERPGLYINFRLWNLADVNGIGAQNADFLKRICEHFNFTMPPSVDVRWRKGVRIRGRLYLHFDTEFQWPSLDLPVLGTHGRCHGLSSHFGILADGTVVPCCLDKEAAIPLGNIGETPLLEILEGVRAQNILQGFRRKKLVEDLCQRCQYIQRFNERSASLQ
ncbi:MAG: SPASM domain-containing protein [Bdellovibrionales bacterium]|nr:SPASM domain-containing protein [Bdellovibrionales bacterium]